MIPKIIHQIWIGEKQKPECTNEIKEKYTSAGYEYILWDEEKIISEYPNGLYNQKQFDMFQNIYCGKADVLRYELLHKYGGVYIDADSLFVNLFEDEFLDNYGFCGYEYVINKLIANGVIGIEKNAKIMEDIINHIHKIENSKDLHPAWIRTGPRLFTNYVSKYPEMKIFPSYYFYPFHPGKGRYSGEGKIYLDHFWGTTLNKYKNKPVIKF